MNEIYQQGDVILAKANLPEDAKPRNHPRRGDGYVLAEGEATGHAHVLEEAGVEMYEDANGTVWVRVSQSSVLRHEEHNEQTIGPGTYRIGKVREVDPFSDEIREVMD